MGDKSKIEWTDATWNPVRGCSLVSSGCTNCYAMRAAHRLKPYHGLTRRTEHGPVWTGEVRLVPEMLDLPLRWKKPRRIFVNSMSDLFHEKVPDGFILDILRTIRRCPQHIFQVLTKHPERMATFFQLEEWEKEYLKHIENLWLGVSVENQKTANERVPLLLQTPAAVRWISAEPLLGPIDLGKAHPCGYYCDPDVPSENPLWGHHDHDFWTPGINTIIKWVVAGGESGPHARPMHPAWPRSLRDQCQTAGVPFFFKQHGEWIHQVDLVSSDKSISRILEAQIHDWSDQSKSYRVGKKAAGALLDGREWREMPRL